MLKICIALKAFRTFSLLWRLFDRWTDSYAWVYAVTDLTDGDMQPSNDAKGSLSIAPKPPTIFYFCHRATLFREDKCQILCRIFAKMPNFADILRKCAYFCTKCFNTLSTDIYLRQINANHSSVRT